MCLLISRALAFALLLLTIGTTSSCTSGRLVDSKPLLGPHLDQAATRNWLVTHEGEASFVSRNGKFYGMDSDARVIFKGSRYVEVLECGYTPITYTGTYSVARDGAISLELTGYRSTWPDMYLHVAPESAYLMPVDGNPSFRMGDRAGAVETSAMAPYWPFRQSRL